MVISEGIFHDEASVKAIDERGEYVRYRVIFRKESWDFDIKKLDEYGFICTEKMALVQAYNLYKSLRSWIKN